MPCLDFCQGTGCHDSAQRSNRVLGSGKNKSTGALWDSAQSVFHKESRASGFQTWMWPHAQQTSPDCHRKQHIVWGQVLGPNPLWLNHGIAPCPHGDTRLVGDQSGARKSRRCDRSTWSSFSWSALSTSNGARLSRSQLGGGDQHVPCAASQPSCCHVVLGDDMKLRFVAKEHMFRNTCWRWLPAFLLDNTSTSFQAVCPTWVVGQVVGVVQRWLIQGHMGLGNWNKKSIVVMDTNMISG